MQSGGAEGRRRGEGAEGEAQTGRRRVEVLACPPPPPPACPPRGGELRGVEGWGGGIRSPATLLLLCQRLHLPPPARLMAAFAPAATTGGEQRAWTGPGGRAARGGGPGGASCSGWRAGPGLGVGAWARPGGGERGCGGVTDTPAKACSPPPSCSAGGCPPPCSSHRRWGGGAWAWAAQSCGRGLGRSWGWGPGRGPERGPGGQGQVTCDTAPPVSPPPPPPSCSADGCSPRPAGCCRHRG